MITAFLGQADEPEGVSTLEGQRYWELAGNELRRIISSSGGTPLSATAAGEPALLCLGEQGAAIVTIRGNSFVVHRVRRGAGPISIRESGPMLAEFSERDCNIEIDVPGLPGAHDDRFLAVAHNNARRSRSARPELGFDEPAGNGEGVAKMLRSGSVG